MADSSAATTEVFTALAPDADAMKALGRALGRVLQPGDVLGLIGPLGAGKTTFAQGVAQGLDVPPERHVASPTFALVNEHPGRVPFVHADLYRVENEAELAELGLADLTERAAAVIEWIDRFPSAAPPDHVRVELVPSAAGTRELRAASLGARSRRVLAEWRAGYSRT